MNPSLTIRIPWPHYDLLTATGNVSAAKMAGKPLPWLGHNVVNNMPREFYRRVKEMWRDAACDAGGAALRAFQGTPVRLPMRVDTVIYKRTAAPMDAFAVLEGIKPLLDGIVLAGLLPDDGPDYICGGYGRALKAPDPSLLAVVMTFSEGYSRL